MAKTSDRTRGITCRLKELRTQKKMTQTGLAGLIGIKRQAVYDIEAVRYLPNTGVALALAQVLDCRVEDIFSQAPAQSCHVTLVDEDHAWGQAGEHHKSPGPSLCLPPGGNPCQNGGFRCRRRPA